MLKALWAVLSDIGVALSTPRYALLMLDAGEASRGAVGGIDRAASMYWRNSVDELAFALREKDEARAYGREMGLSELGALTRETDRRMREAGESFLEGLAPRTPLSNELFFVHHSGSMRVVGDVDDEIDRLRRQAHERKRAARRAYEKQRRHTNAVVHTAHCKQMCARFFSGLNAAGVALTLPDGRSARFKWQLVVACATAPYRVYTGIRR